MAEEKRIQQVLAYYDNEDWAACACEIVRRFGISGGLGLVKSIRELIEFIRSIEGVLKQIREMMDRADFLMSALLPSSLWNSMVYQLISKIKICPAITDLLLSMGEDAGEIIRRSSLNKWLSDRKEVISKSVDDNISKVQDWSALLMRLEQMILVMENCVSVATGGQGFEGNLSGGLEVGLPDFSVLKR